MSNNLAIMVHFDGDARNGVYSVYPANEDSEPDFDFCPLFYYGGSDDYQTKDKAQKAAEAEAARIAQSIGGAWYSNE